jgi:hypothetical protein
MCSENMLMHDYVLVDVTYRRLVTGRKTWRQQSDYLRD